MKRFIPIVLVLLGLLIAYWAWPFLELRALAAALRAGNVTAINKEVDSARYRSGEQTWRTWSFSNVGRGFSC
jgi:hypothetical protein